MAIKKAKDKDGQMQVGISGEEQPIKAVILMGTDGEPYNAGGGGGGGSFDGQLTQGGDDVSVLNPLPVATKEFYANSWQAVTPSDTTNLSPVKGLYVGTGGNVSMRINGVDNTLFNVQSGTILFGGATRINATGTTASNIVAFF